MISEKLSIPKAFRKSIIILFLILFSITSILVIKNKSSDIASILIGLPLFIAFFYSIFGTYQIIKGYKEPNSIKKIFSIFINFGMIIIFLLLLLGNIVDIYSFVKS